MTTVRARRRRRKSATASAAALLVAALGAAPPALQACGYHDPSRVGLGMLNWAYPDALHVRTAVWMAQRDGALVPDDAEPLEPGSPAHVLRQMQRFRQTEMQLRAWHRGLATNGQAQPSFAVVFIESMLWTRFETVDGALAMAVHADGPRPGDVVVVTDRPVVAALAAGRLAPRAARAAGLLRMYGEPTSVERVAAVLDGFDGPGMDATSTEREGTRR